MKKFILTILLSAFVLLTATAGDIPSMKYKGISNKDKISYNSNNDTWSRKINKNENYYVKTKGFGDFFDYNDASGNFAFSTNCEFEFIQNNNLIGYSNKDLKFYNISYINGGINKRELSKDEVSALFPEYTVISITDFSPNTNSYKIKKHIGELKILILNDTDKIFDNYKFSSGNAKYKQYSLRGFLTVSQQGMIQFSGNETNDYSPMFVLLIR